MRTSRMNGIDWQEIGSLIHGVLVQARASRVAFAREAKVRGITVEQLTAAAIVGCLTEQIEGSEQTRERSGR